MGLRPLRFARVTNPFAAPGSYLSRTDQHGPAGHHTGIDFGRPLAAWFKAANLEGRPIRSSTEGVVVISAYNDTMGNWVGVYYAADNVLLTYWHMQRRNVREGQVVFPGTLLGWVGQTGNSNAPHLHVQANRGREFDYSGHIDPTRWVRGREWARLPGTVVPRIRRRVGARR